MTHKIVGIAPRLRRPERVADQRVSARDVSEGPAGGASRRDACREA